MNESEPVPLKKSLPLLFAALFTAVFIVYGNILHSPFLFDDDKNVESNPAIRNLDNHTKLSTFSYRQFVFFTFALNYKIGKLDPFGYHLFDFLLHLCAVLLVFLVAFVTVEKGMARGRRLSIRIAFATALLFGLNPILSEAVTYISGRATVLAAVFYFLALFLFISASLRDPGFSCPRPLLFLFFWGAFFLAVVTKEVALTLPLIAVLYDVCFMKGERWIDVKSRMLYFYALLPVFALVFMLKSPDSVSVFQWWAKHMDYVYALVQIKVVGFAVKLFYLPVNQIIDYDMPNTVRLDPGLAAGGLIWAAILWLAVKRKILGRPLLFFVTLWFLIAIAPTDSFIPREDLFNERNLYLPAFALAFLPAVLVCNLMASARNYRPAVWIFCFAGLASVLCFHSVLTVKRNSVYLNGASFWEDAYRKAPRKMRVLHNLSAEYMKSGDYGKALDILSKIEAINPAYAFIHVNRAIIYKHYGNLPLAVKEFEAAVATNPDIPEAYINIGSYYASIGLFQKAKEAYTAALAKSGVGRFPELFLDLAKVDMQLGLYEEAQRFVGEFQSKFAYTLEADWIMAQIYDRKGARVSANTTYAVMANGSGDKIWRAKAHNALGLDAIQDRDFKRAIVEFEKALVLNPSLLEARFNLGKLLLDIDNDREKARDHLQKALALNPSPEQAAAIRDVLAQTGRP